MNSLQTLCDGCRGQDGRVAGAVRATGRHPVGGEGVRRVWWRDYLPA